MKNIDYNTGVLTTPDNHDIHYDHYKNGHQKVIILAHGFYNSKQAILFKDMAQDLIDEYDVIVIDFRGHGKSSGLFGWTAKEHQDLEVVIDFANKNYSAIGVVGFSLGAAVSIITTARSKLVKSLIAVSPPTEFGKIDFRLLEMYVEENIIYNVIGEGRIGKGIRPGPFWLKKTKPIDVVDQIKVPILFIHGQKDWLIQPWHSEKLFKKAKGLKRLEIVKEGTHAEYLFRRDREGTIKLFKDWFHETL